MAEIDAETVERVRRWCAEAGRQATGAEIHAALAPLSWDELLTARALLADPPPARPLGPHALADLARGVPADLAAEREREGRYRSEAPSGAPEPVAAGSGPLAPPAPRPARRRAGARPAAVVVRRARDRASPEPAAPAPLPEVAELRAPAGRNVLERLVRTHGARRAAIGAALARGWRRADGGAPGAADLGELLELHGMAHAFERRERDELLHALRAAGGVRTRAAARLGLDAAGLDAAVARLGAGAEAERIRDERRADLRSRATLSERVALLVRDEERLADLGLLEELEADLRARLPEHVRALAGTGEPLADALARSLSLGGEDAAAIATRFGLALPSPKAARGPRAPARAPGVRRPAPRRDRREPPSSRPPPPARGKGRASGKGRPGGGAKRPRPPRRPTR